jgi:uncharacterized membrane protein YcaP (DUF421 family)
MTGLLVCSSLIWVFEKAAQRIKLIRKVSEGKPEVIIKDGSINWDIAKRAHLEQEEILMLLRMKNVWSVEEVKLGILESNGTISARKNK